MTCSCVGRLLWWLILSGNYLVQTGFSQQHECAMSPIWMCQVTRMNASRHPYEYMPHSWIRHNALLTESWHTCEFIMTRTYVRDVTHRHASQHTFEWVVAPFWMHHDTRMNALWHTLGCIMSQLWLRCSAFLSASWHTFVSVMTRINASWHTLHIWRRSVLQCMLKCVAVCCNAMIFDEHEPCLSGVAVCCSVHCSVLQCVLQWVAVCVAVCVAVRVAVWWFLMSTSHACLASQGVAVRCSVL